MTKVFVHGNPETTEVWDALIVELADQGVDDVVRLSPPGFGAAIPDGFGCTVLEYRDWLIGELEKLRKASHDPIDIVGHDWGAGHLYAVAAERGDLLRSWVADCSGIIHPDYVWHETARIWQAPDDGERHIEEYVKLTGADFAANSGVPESYAHTMAANIDDQMGRAILAVYRSAQQPVMRELGERLARAPRRPALIVHATRDEYTHPEFTDAVAHRVGADVLTLEGSGHWWMVERAADAATGLTAFWSEL